MLTLRGPYCVVTEGSVTTRHVVTARHRHNGGIDNPAPLDVPEAQSNTPNAKVPNFWPSRVFSCWFPCISAFVFLGIFGLASVTCAHPYQRAFIIWLCGHCFRPHRTRMWAVHPRLLHWIGEPSRPLLASPIVVWPFGRVQDIPFRKRLRIPLTTPRPTIR